LIREFLFDKDSGFIVKELSTLPSGLCTGHPDGPRYFEFHPTLNIAYVVNELSSTIAVFSVDKQLLKKISKASANKELMDAFVAHSTLKLIQSISTIPIAFPRKMNTCGRVAVHPSGNYVIVSNRGHESLTIFRVHRKGQKRGHLSQVGFFHTRGETPRHFQFDSSGQYLIVANQDSNTIAVFSFNLSSGEIKYTGNEYRVPSPNFVCCCAINETPKAYESDEESLSSIVTAETATTDSDSETNHQQLPKKNLEMELELARFEIIELKRQLNALANFKNVSSDMITTKISALTEDSSQC